MKIRLNHIVRYAALFFSFFVLIGAFIWPETAFAVDINFLKNPNGCFQDMPMCLGSIVSAFVVSINLIFSVFLYLAGVLLDWTLSFSIFTDLYNSHAILAGWTLLRDILNIVFIFVLLYIAIGTALRLENVNWKKSLTAIVIAALLVNFSLFLTRVVVDAGNIIAASLYNNIIECPVDGCEVITPGGNQTVESATISERLMDALAVVPLWQMQGDALDEDDFGWNGVANNLIKLIVIFAAIWIFVAIAILFIIRTFALIFLFVLSPIGIAGVNLPFIKGRAKEWRENLFKWTFLPAIFLFFIFVIILFATGEPVDTTEFEAQAANSSIPITTTASRDDQSAESLFITYLLVLVALIMAMRISKSMSGKVGETADALGKVAIGASAALVTGGTAMALRGTAGAASAVGAKRFAASSNEFRKNAQDPNRSRFNRAYNRFQAGASAKFSDISAGMARSSFDVRTTKLGGALGQTVKKQTGINIDKNPLGIGEVEKGGYLGAVEEEQKKRNKREAERAERFATVDADEKAVKEARRTHNDDDKKNRENVNAALREKENIEREKQNLAAEKENIDQLKNFLETNKRDYEADREALKEIETKIRKGETLTPEEARARTSLSRRVEPYEERRARVTEYENKASEINTRITQNDAKIETLKKQRSEINERWTDRRKREAFINEKRKQVVQKRTLEYADRLEDSSKGADNPVMNAVRGRERGIRRNASQNLKKEATKSKGDKLIEDFQKEVERLKGEEGGGEAGGESTESSEESST